MFSGTTAGDLDAVVLTAERGSAWTLMYPQFSVVVPTPGTIKVPLAYPIARHDAAFAAFINAWIELKKKDGTIDASTTTGSSAVTRRRPAALVDHPGRAALGGVSARAGQAGREPGGSGRWGGWGRSGAAFGSAGL